MAKRDSEVMRSYRESLDGCEVCALPWDLVADGRWQEYGAHCRLEVRNHILSGVVVHHIIGGHSRADRVANLIGVCGFFHAWLHDHDSIAGRIVAMKAKMDKGEFDADALSAIWGKRVAGWLEWDDVVTRCSRSEILEGWRLELLEGCK